MADGDLDDPVDYGSIVRNNLMKRPKYTPYCGDGGCRFLMPRMGFDGDQFRCMCGYRTNFPDDFMEGYKARWCSPSETANEDRTW